MQPKENGATLTTLWAIRDADGCFSASERACLYGLVAHMGASWESSPGNSGLAAATGLDERHVRRVIDALIERGIVVVIKPHTPRTPAVYRLSLASIEAARKHAAETPKAVEEKPTAKKEGGQVAPSGGTSNLLREGTQPPGERVVSPLREGRKPPIEDLLEDQEVKEDLRGKHIPAVGGTCAPPVEPFALAHPEPKRTKRGDRTKDKPAKMASNAEHFRGYAAAFKQGYARGVGGVVSVEAITRPEHVLVQALNTFAREFMPNGPRLEGDAVLAWIEQKAEEFGKRFGKVQYPYHKFNDFLNGTNDAKSARDTGTQPAATNTATSWRAGLDEQDKQRLAKQAAEKGIVV